MVKRRFKSRLSFTENKSRIKSKSSRFIKKSINNYIKFPPKLKMEIDEFNNIHFELINNKPLINVFLEIRHRKTGKRLEKEMKSYKVSVPLNEILEMVDEGTLDLFVKIIGFKHQFRKRISFSNQNQYFKAFSKERGLILKAISTGHGNLSIDIKDIEFIHRITELKQIDERIFIKGNLETFNDEIKKIDKITVVGKNRLDSQKNYYELEFHETESNKYSFEGFLEPIEIRAGTVPNVRIDFYLRIYDEIYYQELIDLFDFTDYSKIENSYLIAIEKEDIVYSYYATENLSSLALWITTKNAYDKAYTIAKGKTIYNDATRFKLNENMIFFESFFGKSYSGNPKYIYETLLRMGYGDKFTFVWAYSGENKNIIPGNPIIVDRNEAGDYFKYLAQSKYWVNNILFPIHMKRKGNVYLQTWHGTPLKKLGWDITIPGPEVDGRKNFYSESRNWDYLISSNEYSSEIFKRAFKFNKKILELGYPINDIFFNNNTEFINNLKDKLNIAKDKKVILYAPTWKDDEQKESWEHYFNLEIDLNRLYMEFKDDYVILLKMHHLVSENLKIDEKLKDFAIDLSGYDDIQELYILSDILITDYSSVFFDYAHSRRPILFFVPDLNHYVENVRGLYLNMKKELPGPLIKDNNQLIDVLNNIDDVVETYEDKYNEFYERFCSLCTGDSGEKIVKEVFNLE